MNSPSLVQAESFTLNVLICRLRMDSVRCVAPVSKMIALKAIVFSCFLFCLYTTTFYTATCRRHCTHPNSELT
jgi:hypothetical protein